MSQYANRFTSVPPSSQSANFAAATAGTQIKTGPGVLVSVNTNTPLAASSITLYDGTDTTGRKLGTFATTVAGQVLANFAFTIGLFAVVVNGGGGDCTVGYR